MALSWLEAYPGGKVASWLSDAGPFGKASGCYLIKPRGGRVVYVGMSASGRLARTIRRHFQYWPDSDEFTFVRRRGGRPPAGVLVAVVTMPRASADSIREAEANLTRIHRPTWLQRLARRAGDTSERGGGKVGRAARRSKSETATKRERRAADTFLGALLGY